MMLQINKKLGYVQLQSYRSWNTTNYSQKGWPNEKTHKILPKPEIHDGLFIIM